MTSPPARKIKKRSVRRSGVHKKKSSVLEQLNANAAKKASPPPPADDGPEASRRTATDGPPRPAASHTKPTHKTPTKARPAAVPAKSAVPRSPGKSAHDKVDHFGFDAEGERELDKVMRPVDACLRYGKWKVLIALREELGHGDRAIVLTQIYYWMGRGRSGERMARAQWDGMRYVAKTREDLASEIGMTARQVGECLVWLRDNNWIQLEAHSFGKKNQRRHKSYIRPIRSPNLRPPA